MLPTLASRNDDIRRLVEKGYAVAFDSNYLVVRDIPYLGPLKELKWGAFATLLVFEDKERVRQKNHQVSFTGSAPHGLDGKPIPNLGDSSHTIPELHPRLVVERQFSNKPANGYVDFFDKIERYVAIISGPAMEAYGVTPLTFREYESPPDDSVFKVRDTLTTLAEIGDLAAAFKEEVVAIIGLGGTGSYVLDYMARTPVKEIRAFDGDDYHVHNAYRSPGRLLDDGELGSRKADVYAGRYENFRHGLHFHAKYIDEESAADLNGVTFAFVCVDKGTARAKIIDLLIALKVPFIDVGMGLNRKRGPISGDVRTTFFAVGDAEKVRDARLVPTHDNPDDIYKTNIQIAELNALNAALAVLTYKKKRGFYVDDEPAYNLLFRAGDLRVVRQSDEL